MSVFLLSKSFSEWLDSAFRKFRWRFAADGSRHYYPLAWKDICKPKEDCGLGLRKRYQLNLAMVAKIGWQLLVNPNQSWSLALKAKYFKNCSFLAVEPYQSNSWMWRGICNAKHIMENKVYRKIKIGSSENVWCKPWIPGLEGFKPKIREGAILSSTINTVGDLIDAEETSWKEHEVRSCFDHQSA